MQQVLVILENCDCCSKWMVICVMFLKQRWAWGWGKGTHGYLCVQRCALIPISTTELLISLSPWWPLQLGMATTRFHLTMRLSLSSPSSVPHSPVSGMRIQFWATTDFANDCNILRSAEAQMKGTWYPVLLIHRSCRGLTVFSCYFTEKQTLPCISNSILKLIFTNERMFPTFDFVIKKAVKFENTKCMFLFIILFQEMDNEYKILLFHVKIRWLSGRKLFISLLRMRTEIKGYLFLMLKMPVKAIYMISRSLFKCFIT